MEETKPKNGESEKIKCNNLAINAWDEKDKPREKMFAKGKTELSNAELVGILLGSGTPGTTAVDLAKKILNYTSEVLTPLTQMEISDFMKFHGVGLAKAATLTAALELGRRICNENYFRKETVVKDSATLYDYIHTDIDNQQTEHFMVVYLNNRGKVLGNQCISQGGITCTVVDLRTIFKYAVTLNAVSIALAHNHPSGNLKPSREDENLTKRIVDAAKLFDIRVLDHLIVGPRTTATEYGKYYSFRDYGKM
jgi:DNA repair protein RadC